MFFSWFESSCTHNNGVPADVGSNIHLARVVLTNCGGVEYLHVSMGK